MRRYKAQFISMILMIALGIGVFVDFCILSETAFSPACSENNKSPPIRHGKLYPIGGLPTAQNTAVSVCGVILPKFPVSSP